MRGSHHGELGGWAEGWAGRVGVVGGGADGDDGAEVDVKCVCACVHVRECVRV